MSASGSARRKSATTLPMVFSSWKQGINTAIFIWLRSSRGLQLLAHREQGLADGRRHEGFQPRQPGHDVAVKNADLRIVLLFNFPKPRVPPPAGQPDDVEVAELGHGEPR